MADNETVAVVEAPAQVAVETPTPAPAVKEDASGRLHGEGGKFVKKSRSPEEQVAFDKALQEQLFGKGEEEPAKAAPAPAKAEQEQPELVATPTPAKEKSTGAYDKALKALQFDGYDASALEKLGKEEVIRLGTLRQKNQTEVNAKLQRLAELEKQTTAKPKEPQPKAGEPGGQGLDFAPLVKPFADEYGEEAGKALTSIAKAIEKAVLERVAPQADSAAAVAEAMLLKDARAKLGVRYSKLADDGWFESEIKPLLEPLAATGLYKDFDALVLGAFKQAASEEDLVPPPKDHSQARRNGQPFVPTSTTIAPSAPVDPEARQRAAFMLIDEANRNGGVTPDVVAKARQVARSG